MINRVPPPCLNDVDDVKRKRKRNSKDAGTS